MSVWLPRYGPRATARLRLFCFPYSGGNSFIFRNWQARLPQAVELCAVQLPGRAARLKEQPFSHLKPLVEAVAAAISPAFDKPFAFFGHSMGALISFELARFLRRRQMPQPVHLFVSGRRGPQVPDTDPPFHDMPEPEFIKELRRLNGTPGELFEHEELMQVFIPLLRADFSVCQTYVYTPEPPLDCSITAYGGAADPEIRDERLQAWREQTTALYHARIFPGDHFFLNTAQEQVLKALSDDLLKIALVVL
jgi:medium-chain acyl-[acyl-carrier-protein] hydrolase